MTASIADGRILDYTNLYGTGNILDALDRRRALGIRDLFDRDLRRIGRRYHLAAHKAVFQTS